MTLGSVEGHYKTANQTEEVTMNYVRQPTSGEIQDYQKEHRVGPLYARSMLLKQNILQALADADSIAELKDIIREGLEWVEDRP